MNKYKFGDKLKSNFTGLGIQYGKEYTVEQSKYQIPFDCVLIRNDEGYVEFYDEEYFKLA
jgi:hypothetical protein